MPILIKDYTWCQTEKTLHIRIPLNAVSHEKVDLFTSDTYIKAHFSPFLFELFLLHDVYSDKSKCIIKEDLIVIDLNKKEYSEWECLEKEMTKVEKMKTREEIHAQCQEKAKQEAEDRRIKMSQLDRFTVQQAMDLDTKQHALMDSRRDYERKTAMGSLEEWRLHIDKHTGRQITNYAENRNSGVKIIELPPDFDDSKDVKKNISKTSYNKIQNSIARKPEKTTVKSEYVEKRKKEEAKRVLPRLRETAELQVTHTPRTFPTPSRESTAEEEQAWLKNITLARRATGFLSEDLRPEEQDPQWCKEKGDEFFRNGNFLGAISAYTHGITLSDKLPSLYANRSATHFALGNFNKCLNDCSSAIELMKPACEKNRVSRAKCIARRGAALARLGYMSKAIDEMKAASKLLPDDEKIKKDVFDMERAWEQTPDSD